MMKFLRNLSKRFMVSANLVVCFVFLLSFFQPYLDPDRFWILGFLSLALPYLLILVICFFLFWVLLRKKYLLISLICIIITLWQINTLYNIDGRDIAAIKDSSTLRIMTWNVRSFQGFAQDSARQKEKVKDLFSYISTVNPDVLLLQEFGHYDRPDSARDYLKALSALGYKYHLQSKDYVRVKFSYTNGLAILSRFPISDGHRIPFTSSAESLLYGDITFQGKKVRLFNTHLQSFKFAGSDFESLNRIKRADDSSLSGSRTLFGKMRRAFRNRAQQAAFIRPYLDTCSHPFVLGVDMNDVPNSYAYWQLRGNRKDAFLEMGRGIGRSFRSLAPTLRIDYIFARKDITVTGFRVGNVHFSDHFPLFADLKIP